MKSILVDEIQRLKLEQLSEFYDESIQDLISQAIDVMFSFTFEDGEVDHGFEKRKNTFRYCSRIG